MELETLLSGLEKKDRRYLSKAITLVESDHPRDKESAQKLLSKINSQRQKSLRIGVSGVPGAGKSSFMEALGSHITEVSSKSQIAVLSVDPSSPLSGGSILGDKVRMEKIATHPRVYIRPSPNRGYQGGLTPRTHEVMCLLEASGFDLIFIETVGVGQSEYEVCNLVDLMILIQGPALGDDVQAMKKGILELADLIVVNKNDGQLASQAALTQTFLQQALHLKNTAHLPSVFLCSCHEGTGIKETWEGIEKLVTDQKKSQTFQRKRELRGERRLQGELFQMIKTKLKEDKVWQKKHNQVLRRLKAEEITPFQGAQTLWQELLEP